MILNYCLPNNFGMSRFNYQRSFGLVNIFLAMCMQGLFLHDKMHGPEKIELLQHILQWKEKFDRFLWPKKKNHHNILTLYTIWTTILQNDIESKISFTDIIKVMIPQMISCTTEKKYYDFCTDLNGLWFPRWCYVAWDHHDNDSSKSNFGVMIPQMVLSNLKTSGLWFVCLTESYDDMIKPEQITLWFLKHIQLSPELSLVIQYPNFLCQIQLRNPR